MKKILIATFIILSLTTEGYSALRRRTSSYYAPQYYPEYKDEVKTAQGVANIMARLTRVGHFGGNPGYEGCGSGPTKESAFNNCCYANSGMQTVDVGYAQDANGFWYCCRRYK